MTTDRSPYGVGGYGTGTYGYSPYVHAEAASNVLLASIADAQRAVYRYFTANSVIVTSAIANAITSYTALAAASGFAGISSTALAQAVFGASASSTTHFSLCRPITLVRIGVTKILRFLRGKPLTWSLDRG